MSLLNTILVREVEPGTYTTRIRNFEEVTHPNRQPYIAVEMVIDGLDVTDRWYANRIPYIMSCLRKQFNMEYMDCTLSKLLKVCSENDFFVTVSYHPRYDRQIDYREEVF